MRIPTPSLFSPPPASPTTIFNLIVTALLLFSQPLIADDLRPGRTIDPGDFPDAIVEELTLPEGLAGPSFYPDYLVHGDRDLLFAAVLPAGTPLEVLRKIYRAGGGRVALLVTAPRSDPADTGRIAAGIPVLSNHVPRVFVSFEERSEWLVSVPGIVGPLWLTRAVATYSDIPVNTAQVNAAHLGFGRRDPALRSALAAALPAARLFADSPEAVETTIASLVAGLEREAGLTREEDRTYLILPLRDPLFISEFAIVQGLMTLSALLLLYMIILPRRALHYLRSIIHNLPAILISFLALTTSLIVANITLRLAGRLVRISPSPLLLAGGKMSLGVVVLSVLATALSHRIRRATAVYSGAAVLLLLLGAVISGSVSVILGAFFATSFLFGVLFSLGPNVWIKTPALLCSLAPILYLVLALAPAADEVMASALLTPPLAQEVVTAIMLLPILLMFFRLDAITPSVPLVALIAMIATVGLALVTATVIVQARRPDPYHLTYVERYTTDFDATGQHLGWSGERTVSAEDLRAEGPVILRTGDGAPGVPEDARRPVDDARSVFCETLPCVHPVDPPDAPVSLEVTTTRILDRHTLRWEVSYRKPAETVEILIQANREVQLYATDFPTVEPVGSRGRVFTLDTGPYPPERLAGTLVIRSDHTPVQIRMLVHSSFPIRAVAVDEAEFLVVAARREWIPEVAVTLQ